jgi:electron transfer flavoprotein beta subunit
MAAKSKPIEQTTAADLGITDSAPGQTITEVRPVEARQAGEIVTDDGEAHLRIVAALEQAKVI